MSLEQAKEWLRARFEKGARCPCCTRKVKLYKRKLNSNMGAALIYMYHCRPGEWIPMKRYLVARKRYFPDAPQMRHRGLIERRPQETGQPSDGMYRITELGRAFVEGAAVRNFLYTFNNAPVRRRNPDLEQVTIRQALGEHFDYDELMAATPDGSSTL